MNVQEYQEYWVSQGIDLEKLALEKIHAIPLPLDLLDFLSGVGLPVEAAPYLTFSLNAFPAFCSPDDVYDVERPDLSDYFIIGGTGESDPIVLNPQEGFSVSYLETENDFNKVFMNSSLDSLSLYLLMYDQFVQKYSDEESDGLSFQDADIEYLIQQLTKIDAPAMEEGTFWSYYVDYLHAENNSTE
jgi:hypothetical protein